MIVYYLDISALIVLQQEHLERTLAEEREKNDERVKEVIEEEQQNQKVMVVI